MFEVRYVVEKLCKEVKQLKDEVKYLIFKIEDLKYGFYISAVIGACAIAVAYMLIVLIL